MTSTPDPTKFTCSCSAGYDGIMCEEVQDPCESEPCLNGGSCAGTPDGFTCQCPSHFGGPTCTLGGFVCSSPSVPNHASLIEAVAMFQAGEVATFLCDNGYTTGDSGDHSATRICRSDGTWSGEHVECLLDEGDAMPCSIFTIFVL